MELIRRFKYYIVTSAVSYLALHVTLYLQMCLYYLVQMLVDFGTSSAMFIFEELIMWGAGKK
jgi:hypothetical protein